MSYIQYTVQCQDCGKQMNTAFGIVGTTQIAAPVRKCPACGSERLNKIADGWQALNLIPEEPDAPVA